MKTFHVLAILRTQVQAETWEDASAMASQFRARVAMELRKSESFASATRLDVAIDQVVEERPR